MFVHSPSNVESHEGHASAHDEEQRLQSFVMSEGLDCDSLHGPNSVVSLEQLY